MNATAERTTRETEPMSDEMREFLLLVRRGLMPIIAHIEKICGIDASESEAHNHEARRRAKREGRLRQIEDRAA